MTKLKPCPFCGGEAQLTDAFQKGWRVGCSLRNICKVHPYVRCTGKGARKQAIEAWNNRPSPWQTGTPTEETNEDNEYCYALMIYYDGWYLSDYLFKANHKEGCFETSPRGDEKPIKFKFSEDNPPFHTAIRWQKINPPFKEASNG